MVYDEPVFRPPSEAYSLILQPTVGCSWNRCAFCEMYSTKKFRIREISELKREINEISSVHPDIRKVFLADGDALVLQHDYLLELLTELNKSFTKLTRVSAYALPKDILAKTDEELSSLCKAGLKLIYVGIESGDDEVLQMVSKNETAASTVEGLLKAKNAGIKLSVMILNGLGGKSFSRQHAENSAQVINMIQPEYLSTLVLSYPRGIDHFKKRFKGSFDPCDIRDLLQELMLFINTLALDQTVFRSDHASNYLVLKGILGRDKMRILSELKEALANPDSADLRPEWLRGL